VHGGSVAASRNLSGAWGVGVQTFGLIPILTAAENVEVPLRLVGAEPRERDRRVAELLDT